MLTALQRGYTERMKHEGLATGRGLMRRWRGWAVWLGVLALLVAGVRWYCRVPEFVVVERTALPRVVTYSEHEWGTDLAVVARAVLQYQEPSLSFTPYGHLYPQFRYYDCELFGDFSWQWSSRRQYLASMGNDTLCLWHNDRCLYRMKLPFHCTHLLVMDSGCIYLWSGDSRQICLLKDQRILARGTLPRPTPSSITLVPVLSPDGGTMLIADDIVPFTFYRVTIAGARLVFSKRFSTSEPVSPPMINDYCFSMFIGKVHVLFTNGARYNLKGMVKSADDWHVLFSSLMVTDHPGNAVIQQYPVPDDPENYAYRSLNLDTGECWIIPQVTSIS